MRSTNSRTGMLDRDPKTKLLHALSTALISLHIYDQRGIQLLGSSMLELLVIFSSFFCHFTH